MLGWTNCADPSPLNPAYRVIIPVNNFTFDVHHSVVDSADATQMDFISATQRTIALDDDHERGPPKGQPRALENDKEGRRTLNESETGYNRVCTRRGGRYEDIRSIEGGRGGGARKGTEQANA